jgi:hypothetical protein
VTRRAPRQLGDALATLSRSVAPAGTLAEVQALWADAVGAAVAERARPLSERAGVLVIGCREAVWAQELELMGPELCERLNAALGRTAVTRVRCRVTDPA